MMDAGFLPWWTLPDLKASFFRPASALTHWLDHLLWPDSPELMHAHNLVWLGLSVLVAGFLYRRMLGATVAAGLALIFFALDDAHAQPAAWIANRNALVAFVPAVVSLMCQWRAAERSSWGWTLLSAAFWAIALGAAEGAVGIFGYLVAVELFLDRRRVAARVAAIVPHLLVLLVWRIVYDRLGYGAYGSGVYVDGAVELRAFAAALLAHSPVNLLGQWAVPPAEVYIAGLERHFAAKLVWIALAFVGLLAFMLVPMLRRDERARFFAFGMLAALVPSASALPMDRLLLFVGIGGHALAAMFIVGLREQAGWTPGSRWWRGPARAFGVVLVLVHLVLAPAMLVLRSRAAFRILEPGVEAVTAMLPPEAHDPAATLVFAAPHSTMDGLYVPLIRALHGKPAARRVRVLAPGGDALRVERPDEHTLIVRPEDGYLAHVLDILFRSPRHPLRLGERVELDGMTATVVELTPDGRAAAAAFRFEVPLDDPSLVWVCWEGGMRTGRYVRWEPPAVGESVVIGLNKPSLF
jgi:hypothetical protein